MTGMTITIKQALLKCPIFSALSDAEMDKIASLVAEREYNAGTAIFQQGESAEEAFVLQEGKVVLQMSLSTVQSPTTRRVTVDFVSKNELFGGSAIVEPYVYSLTAVCLQKTRVLAINGSKLRAFLRDNYHIGYEVLNGLIKVVVSRLADTRQLLVSERLSPAKPE